MRRFLLSFFLTVLCQIMRQKQNKERFHRMSKANSGVSNSLFCGTQNGCLVCHKPRISRDFLALQNANKKRVSDIVKRFAEPLYRNSVFLHVCLTFFMIFSIGNVSAQSGGKVMIRLIHTMQGEPLALQSKTYTNAAGNQFILDRFKYYLSNIKFRNTRNGSFYLEPDSYHLVSVEQDKHVYEIELENVEPGTYNEFEFAIGVDNAKNTSTDRVGALDPANQMAWNWDTGYKFISVSGKLLTDNGASPEGLVIHVGFDENYRIVQKTLSQLTLPNLEVAAGKTTVIEINVKTDQLFNQPNVINFTENSVIMAGEPAQKLADNYQGMFVVESVE